MFQDVWLLVSDHAQWLSGSLISLLYISSVYSCQLFLMSSASVRSILSVLYCAHLYMKCPLGISIFLKTSLVFPFLLFSSIYLHWSLRKAFLSLLSILWKSAFRRMCFSFCPLPLLLFFSHLFVSPPQTTILPFWVSFSWGWSCTMSQTSANSSQALYQI